MFKGTQKKVPAAMFIIGKYNDKINGVLIIKNEYQAFLITIRNHDLIIDEHLRELHVKATHMIKTGGGNVF